MFFRKLMVVLLPLLLLAGLCFLLPYMDGIGPDFLRELAKGAVLGICLAMIFPRSGGRRHDSLGLALLVPTVLVIGVLVYQYLETRSIRVEWLHLLATQDAQILYLEGVFAGFLTAACIRLI